MDTSRLVFWSLVGVLIVFAVLFSNDPYDRDDRGGASRVTP